MRTTTIIALFVVLLAGTAFAGGTSDNANKIQKRAFIATEYTLAILDPGVVSVSDGILHIRRMVQLTYDVTSDPSLSGYFREVFNANITYVDGVLGSGTGWGTFQSCDETGEPVPGWDGKFVVQIFDLTNLNWIGETNAQGTGQNEGLRLKTSSATDGGSATLVGVIEGGSK